MSRQFEQTSGVQSIGSAGEEQRNRMLLHFAWFGEGGLKGGLRRPQRGPLARVVLHQSLFSSPGVVVLMWVGGFGNVVWGWSNFSYIVQLLC